MKKLVIFDFDGTLGHLDVDYDGLRSRLREYFLRHGIDMVFRPLQKTVLEAVRKVGTKSALTETGRIIDGFETERVENARVAEDVHDVLRNLKRMGHSVAILSNNGEVVIRKLLERHGLLGYFDFIATRNNVPEVKPSSKGILMIMEKLGFRNREDVIMVGDSMYDMISAEKAGVKPVCVMGSEHSPEVRNQGKYTVLKNLSEIYGYLSNQ